MYNAFMTQYKTSIGVTPESQVKASSAVEEKVTAETVTKSSNILKLKIDKPIFSGKSRDFAIFKRDFETIVAVDGRSDIEVGTLLKSCIPLKWKYLLDKVDNKNHKEMMDILKNKFGRARVIVDECTAEIRKMKIITSDQEFIDFVENVDKIKRDLEQLGLLSDIANTTVIADLESKLPYGVKRDWVKLVSSAAFADKLPSEIFTAMLEFFEETKMQAEYHNTDVRTVNQFGKATTKLGFVCGGSETSSSIIKSVKEPPRSDTKACLVCADGATDLKSAMHPTGSCAVWKSLSIREKKEKVNCVRCPYNGKDTKHTTAECQKKKLKCHNCLQEDDHHTWFCTKPKSKTNSCNSKPLSSCSNMVLPPVLVKTVFVSAVSPISNKCGKLGAMFDDCSTDHYVTHEAAQKYNFPGQDVELEVEGIGGIEQTISTKLYTVTVLDIKGNRHHYACYGLDKIATADIPDFDSYRQICSEFRVNPSEVRKPKTIDLLISLRASADHPTKVKSIGDMSLYQGVYGKVFGGTAAELVMSENHESSLPALVKSCQHSIRAQTLRAAVKVSTVTSTKKTDKEFLDLLLEDNIGVDCHPKCGGCRCGRCPIGAKPMSLHDEREYAKFRDNLVYDEVGTEEDPGPYWKTKLPWNINKMELVDNKPAVIGVMNATKKKLAKDPEWEMVYEAQLRELIDKGFAREIPQTELNSWVNSGGKVYFMPHQAVTNPTSKSTPVRVVFNNTLTYAGYSMNANLDLGPDILANLHSLLLRFRNDSVAAAGDIKKMYYMVRVDLEDQFMQLFIWRWSGESELRHYAMTRLVMGNRPSGPISCVAVHETARLGNHENQFPAAFEALSNNTYVDNTFITGPDLNKVKQDISEVELVAGTGGFYYKEWIISGQKVPDQFIAVHLPDQILVEEERALGVNWDVLNDTLSIKVNIQKPSKKIKRKHKYLVEISPTDVITVSPHLTLRIALSIHAKAYDPLGLSLPCKMIGSLLLRLSIQVMRKESQGPIPWDVELITDLVNRWSRYFSMLVALKNIVFPRSFRPENSDRSIDPDIAIFSDGNPDSFGACAYAIWTLLDGTKVARLIMSKAKLSAVLQKGETVRNELSGAVFNCRLKEWISRNAGVTFNNYYPFIDSKIVQAMIQKSSYGYSTFAGLRVGEIQQKSRPGSWLHINSEDNISDILTRGAPPSQLGVNSVWQSGPEWLIRNFNVWPATFPSDNIELEPGEQSIERRFQLKSKCKVAKKFQSVESMPGLDKTIEHAKSLKSLLRIVAYVMRVELSQFRKPIVFEDRDTGNLMGKIQEVSASEFHDAWWFLVHYDQTSRLDVKNVLRLVPVQVEIKLSSYDYVVKYYAIGGRVKNFPVGFSTNSNIPIIPASPFGKLIVSYYHNKFHKAPDTIVAHVRADAWVINCRKLASTIDRRCRVCIIGRSHRAAQLMGDLPSIRSDPISPAWSAVNMDLFGPIWIRDECIKRGPKVNKKVWGVIYCCTKTRGVYLDIATDYSTESILHTVRRLLASKGQVQMIISDCGLQLQGANNEMIEWRKNWDIPSLKRFGAERGLDWQFVMPKSQHQNGAAEILIKMVKGVKESYLRALGDIKLTYNETNTMFLEIAQLCNERPIGIKPNLSTDPVYLSPNSLYLGRTSDRIASGPFQSSDVFDEDPKSFKDRFHLVQAITNQFWKVWLEVYFPSLLIRQKWHTARRNLQKGDICVLRDTDSMRGEWRLVVVTSTFPDEHGRVRNVEVRAHAKQDGSLLYKPGTPSYLKRHVSNLVLLVPVDETD